MYPVDQRMPVVPWTSFYTCRRSVDSNVRHVDTSSIFMSSRAIANCDACCFLDVQSSTWPAIGSKSQNFPTPLSLRALNWGDPYGIFGKALQILKLESLGQPMVSSLNVHSVVKNVRYTRINVARVISFYTYTREIWS